MEENYSIEDHPEWIPTEEQRAAGITETDLMREFPPAEEESDDPEEYWPVDGCGRKIPMNEWTVSDMAQFPDGLREWLVAEHRKRGLLAGAKLLQEMAPSEIAVEEDLANLRLGELLGLA